MWQCGRRRQRQLWRERRLGPSEPAQQRRRLSPGFELHTFDLHTLTLVVVYERFELERAVGGERDEDAAHCQGKLHQQRAVPPRRHCAGALGVCRREGPWLSRVHWFVFLSFLFFCFSCFRFAKFLLSLLLLPLFLIFSFLSKNQFLLFFSLSLFQCF